MKCPRCITGLIAYHRHSDVHECGGEYARCVNCGHYTDPLMEKNKNLTEEEKKKLRNPMKRWANPSMEVEA